MNHHLPTWLSEPALQQLFTATHAAGGELRVVGGAVRDFLLTREGGDIDLATTLLPEQVLELAAAQKWKAIPTGIDHGTVTIVLPERVVEVTTLRRDIATDGRHATVAYTDDWQEDATRRDFTINALYMDAQGEIYDYFRGREDIETRTLRFIGEAAARITEDGLRILRYFRFLAAYGQPPADSEALAAISAKKEMLAALSGQRIAAEMRKLLGVANPAYALRLMRDTGIAPLVFGRDIEPQRIIRLHLLESGADYQTSVWARALLLLPEGREADAAWLSERWKLSRHESAQLQQLVRTPAFDAAAAPHVHTRLLRLDGAPAYLDWLLTQAALTPGIDTAPYVKRAQEFTPPIFPLTAKDLIAQGMQEGKALGDRLRLLESKWEESDYQLTKEALLKSD